MTISINGKTSTPAPVTIIVAPYQQVPDLPPGYYEVSRWTDGAGVHGDPLLAGRPHGNADEGDGSMTDDPLLDATPHHRPAHERRFAEQQGNRVEVVGKTTCYTIRFRETEFAVPQADPRPPAPDGEARVRNVVEVRLRRPRARARMRQLVLVPGLR